MQPGELLALLQATGLNSTAWTSTGSGWY
ncbi:MAG: hypothetical protein JWN31_1302, partial [Frankiales bacterium]|nr:hypothetical protein [Frankiales bacterium]